ncbi:MAG TPA: peptide chain release factor N(5)-glutamine methyltransferase [Terriglobales bacterium]|jgi:release factor glutamine methyltransferase|nr:peptide chain release factor N(5)-glutamine methyltransferase [Terriglobales bacterium]
MQLKAALAAAIEHLTANSVGSPRLNSETLMMFTLSCDRAYLYAHPERELTADEHNRFTGYISERSTGKPAQYITGHQEFWGLDLLVSPAVLIPRPETEHIIETVLELAAGQQDLKIIDVGTGSGCIAIALASELVLAQIEAADISAEALEVARANAARLGFAERIRFHQADLLSGFQAQQLDFIVSNPPYVSEAEPEKTQREVREFEPKVAVFGGPTGMEIYQRLLPQAYECLRDGGWLVMEIGFSIEEPVRALLKTWREVRTINDLQGIPRVVAARK